MENYIDFEKITVQFDHFVQQQLQKNANDEEQRENAKENNINKYLDYLHNRIKIKPIGRREKFQRNLTPMKRLKSFVSIKGFLENLPKRNQEQIESKNSIQCQKNQADLRTHYRDKVENHLKKFSRSRNIDERAYNLLKFLESQIQDKNANRQFIMNIIQNTQAKNSKISYLQIAPQDQIQIQKEIEDILLPLQNTYQTEIKTTFNTRSNNYYKSQRNFKKVSTLLANRLKNILTNRYRASYEMKLKQFKQEKLKFSKIQQKPNGQSKSIIKTPSLIFSKVKTECSKSKFMQKRAETCNSNFRQRVSFNQQFKDKIERILKMAKQTQIKKKRGPHLRNMSQI